MSRSVFLAYPLSAVPDLARLEELVLIMRRRLECEGWTVLPTQGGLERLAPGAVEPAAVLDSNVAGVTGADVLVLLLPMVPEPSSVWVELGMALAARRAIVIVAPNGAALPYLAQLLLLTARSTEGEWPAVWVDAEVPSDGLVDRMVAAVNSMVR